MIKKIFISFCLFFICFLIKILGNEKDLIQNHQILTNKIKSNSTEVTRKELLLQIKQPKLSIVLDLKAGLKNDYYQTVSTIEEETPLFHYIDVVLKDSDLFYRTDKNSIVIGSEWFWLNNEETYQKEYDIIGIYNQKEELKNLITNILSPFDVVKCKYEINMISTKQCAITANKYIHYYLNQFFSNLRKPIFDFSENSSQLIFSAEIYFKNKPLNTLPSTLSVEEWLILIGQLNSERMQFNNALVKKNLTSNLIKIEKENESIGFLLSLIKAKINENIYYQKGIGLFFNQDTMLKLVPIQQVQFRFYNIKQFTDKLNGSFIAQNIKDEIKKEIWIYPENQVIYYKHLEAIIVIAPPQCFPDIDNFFFKLKQSTK